jgi:hypothetical protein
MPKSLADHLGLCSTEDGQGGERIAHIVELNAAQADLFRYIMKLMR